MRPITSLRTHSAPVINWSNPQVVDTPVNPHRSRIAFVENRELRDIGTSVPSSSQAHSLDALIWLAKELRRQQEQQTG
jgi:hypothetical protein